MRSIYLITTSILAIISLSSCGTSENYLTQNYTSVKSNAELLAVQSMIVKPNNVPKPLKFANNEDDVLEKLETSSFVSTLDLTIENIIFEANTYIGTPYRWGGTTRRGIDCSAFMQKIYGVEGIQLPRVSYNQAKVGVPIKRHELQKGDLIFFSTTSPTRVTHVGMVVETDDEIKFIHAASSQGVSIASLSSNYWGKRYRSARRPHQFLHDTLVSVKEADKMLASNR